MPPSALVVTGIVSVQVGAALAGRVFGVVAPAGITGLRLWFAALILAAIGGRQLAAAVRGVLADRAWRDGAVVLAFGGTLGVMNFSIYQSFARIPLGVAVTIEFLGPLAVAVASSRRLVDGLWVVLAGTGVALLSDGGLGSGGLGTLRHGTGSQAAAGVAFGLAAAASWAAYILLSRATGRRFQGSAGLGIAMVVAAVVVTPPAVAAAGRAMFRPGVLAIGLAVGLLSSVIPYRLELEALRRVPARVFGIWMSLEPAVAALAGLAILGQALALRQWLAIGCVMIASAGAARGDPGPAPVEAAVAEDTVTEDAVTGDTVTRHTVAAGPPAQDSAAGNSAPEDPVTGDTVTGETRTEGPGAGDDGPTEPRQAGERGRSR